MSLFDYNNKAEADDLVSMSGHVKWFDAAKGYGFIVPQDSTLTSMRDVLLHISSLRDIGRDSRGQLRLALWLLADGKLFLAAEYQRFSPAHLHGNSHRLHWQRDNSDIHSESI